MGSTYRSLGRTRGATAASTHRRFVSRCSAVAAPAQLHGKPRRGSPEPVGVSRSFAPVQVTNFSLVSPLSTSATLVLYTPEDHAAGVATSEVVLSASRNRTGSVWHVALPGLAPSTLYAWRLGGAFDPPSGRFFDATASLLDPHAWAVHSRPLFGVPNPDGNCWPAAAARLPPADRAGFDWEGTQPPKRHGCDSVIYECSVRGMTAHPSAATAAAKGTYAALVEKIPHLVSLGVTAIELLPIAEWNELETFSPDGGCGGPRLNAWGYSTLAFGAPMARLAAPSADPGEELKRLVRACHAAGLEVILDVVLNHTGEGNQDGVTTSWRGIDAAGFYILGPNGEQFNFSGCGNTVAANHPTARSFFVDILRRWALEYRVDGFRFDLAAILTRAAGTLEAASAFGDDASAGGVLRGTPLSHPPLVAAICEDGVLRGVKLIAEPWDAGGLNQVGAFPTAGGVWAEWNGLFRDDVRRFIKGTSGAVGGFAERMCGSPKLFGARGPGASLNFVTAHDGFSLADLVSYDSKHNVPNGEDNRDGESNNLSWNCGSGPADDGAAGEDTQGVSALRRRQARNLLCALFLAQGTPMLVQGDEVGHTKGGNNNTYCHDAPLNWLDWAAVAADDGGLVRFVSALAALRRRTPALRLRAHPTGDQIAWHGVTPNAPDWGDASRLAVFTLRCGAADAPIYVAFNAGHTPAPLLLPPPGAGRAWRLAIDTALPAPYDADGPDIPRELRLNAAAQRASLAENAYVACSRSVVVCESKAL